MTSSKHLHLRYHAHPCMRGGYTRGKKVYTNSRRQNDQEETVDSGQENHCQIINLSKLINWPHHSPCPLMIWELARPRAHWWGRLEGKALLMALSRGWRSPCRGTGAFTGALQLQQRLLKSSGGTGQGYRADPQDTYISKEMEVKLHSFTFPPLPLSFIKKVHD